MKAKEKKEDENVQKQNDGVERLDPNPVRSRLPTPIKHRIIELFAHFQGLADIHRTIKAEFGVDMDMRDLQHYDPTRPKARIGQRLRELFEVHRAAFIEGVQHHGIAHQAKRLQLLERVIEKATTAKDFGNAIKGLELAAKEMGGTLTNVATVKHEGKVEHRHLTIDDARAELAMRLASVMEGGTLTALPSPPQPEVIDVEVREVATDGDGTP